MVSTIGEADLIAGLSLQELHDAQLNDTTIGDVLREKEKGLNSPTGAGQGHSREARRLFQLWNQLTVKDGLLWGAYEEESGNSFTLQLVVPGQY